MLEYRGASLADCTARLFGEVQATPRSPSAATNEIVNALRKSKAASPSCQSPRRSPAVADNVSGSSRAIGNHPVNAPGPGGETDLNAHIAVIDKAVGAGRSAGSVVW